MKNERGVMYLTVPILYKCYLALVTASLQDYADLQSRTSGRSLWL